MNDLEIVTTNFITCYYIFQIRRIPHYLFSMLKDICNISWIPLACSANAIVIATACVSSILVAIIIVSAPVDRYARNRDTVLNPDEF